MAMLRFGNAAVADPTVTPSNWENIVYADSCKGGKCRMKTARVVLAKYDPKKYLLSHCTIIAAVDVDSAPNSASKFKDYLIKPEFSKFINNNGDAWTKSLLKDCYKTFIGANNYLEHVQIPELSKGKVIDAALRDISLGKDKNGKDLSTLYVDILVATNRKHTDLVRKISSGEMSTLSMGCVIGYSICSKCGCKAVDESEACRHVRWEKNNKFFDENGVERKVAELCGHVSDPDSVKFVDASWVETPAFTGAVRRNIIDVPTDVMAKIEGVHKVEGYTKKEEDFLKAAYQMNLVTAAPADEAPADEAPADEAPADEAPPDEAPPDEEAPEEETAPTDEAPPEDMEFNQDDVKTWKTKVKKKLLEEFGEEIVDEVGKDEDDEGRPTELETLDETLIRPASEVLKKVWSSKKTWNSYLQHKVGHLDKKNFNKLSYGTHMALTSSDLTILADYGYNKRDFLAVMSFIDDNLKKPLELPIKRSIAKLGGLGGRNPVEVLQGMVSEIGRKLTKKEATRSMVWLSLLDYYKD